ncbi:uncharacterized protein METZ01_LOCUS281374 [marine metagenome]|jgi:hypothetical protein|uniref:Peptidase S1 domain-containing protein n=1 Tax=marine metagenome TaxID=408172 RepID=A0A382KVN0_9ZZZZ
MKRLLLGLALVVAMSTTILADGPVEGPLAPYMQDVSVTIRADYGQGSGVIVTREIKDGDKNITVNFVWTAAHVVDNLRHVRQVIDPKTGQSKNVIEFKDAAIVKELVEDGRRVGELKMDARVIKYSDSENGEDLALLMIRKRDFVSSSAVFHTGSPNIVPIGTRLFHVGSLLGQTGAGSMTSGIMSQVGRVLNLGSGDGTVFDQTTATAFPGSSGGGVFISGVEDENKKHRGKYCGMLVRGAGETFNLIVPVRRMIKWSKAVGCEWAISTEAKSPTLAQLQSSSWVVEDSGVEWRDPEKADANNKKYGLRFWLGDSRKINGVLPTREFEQLRYED